MLSLDQMKAYDRVDRAWLMATLRHVRLPDATANLLTAMLASPGGSRLEAADGAQEARDGCFGRMYVGVVGFAMTALGIGSVAKSDFMSHQTIAVDVSRQLSKTDDGLN